MIDQRNEPAVGDEPPTVIGSKMQMFWTTPENAGLRYQFLPLFPFPGDPRLVTGWEDRLRRMTIPSASSGARTTPCSPTNPNERCASSWMPSGAR